MFVAQIYQICQTVSKWKLNPLAAAWNTIRWCDLLGVPVFVCSLLMPIEPSPLFRRNDSTADDGIALIKDDRLSGAYTTYRLIKENPKTVLIRFDDRGRLFNPPIPYLRSYAEGERTGPVGAGEKIAGIRPSNNGVIIRDGTVPVRAVSRAGPNHLIRNEGSLQQVGFGADNHLFFYRIDTGYIASFPQSDSQSTALSNRMKGDSIVGAYDLSRLGYNRPWGNRLRPVLRQYGSVILLINKTCLLYTSPSPRD